MFFRKSAQADTSKKQVPAASPPPLPKPDLVANEASAAVATGMAVSPHATASAKQPVKQMAAAKQSSAALGEIVTVLMRTPAMRQHKLGELEWMVMPAIKTGQFLIAHARSKKSGVVDPAGFVLWALVSPEVDKRLSNAVNPLGLTPAEWNSGDIPWVIVGAGEQKILGGLLAHLKTTVLPGREVKMRVQGADGKVIAATVGMPEAANKLMS